jgi:hypothetical protein
MQEQNEAERNNTEDDDFYEKAVQYWGSLEEYWRVYEANLPGGMASRDEIRKWNEWNELIDYKPYKLEEFGALNFAVNITNRLWELVGNAMIAFGGTRDDISLSYGITDFETFAHREPWRSIFVTFAYSLVILFFGVNLIETTLQYELFTAKGAVKVVGRLFLAKIWVDLSTTICLAILGVANELLNQIILTATPEQIYTQVNIGSEMPLSNVPIVGALLDVIYAFFYLIPLILMLLVIGVLAGLILIKLTLRSLEIAMLIIVSPVFFACLAGDSTKQYFKKFIMNFIGVVFHIVFMAIVYVIGMEWLSQHSHYSGNVFDNFAMWMMSGIPWFITLIAMAVMMIKPPRILTSLVD